MAELPDAKKWFTGFFDVTRWIKDGGTLIRLIVIAIISLFIFLGIKQVKEIITRKQQPLIQTVSGGAVKIDTGETRIKNGLLNLW